MKKIIQFAMTLMLFVGIAAPLTAHATSYVPFLEEHRQFKEKTAMKAGSPVYLFHSGIQDPQTTVPIGDTLAVFRRDPSCELKPVGKIKVLSYAGDNYIRAVVVEGEIRLDDIVRKASTALLVIFSDNRCDH